MESIVYHDLQQTTLKETSFFYELLTCLNKGINNFNMHISITHADFMSKTGFPLKPQCQDLIELSFMASPFTVSNVMLCRPLLVRQFRGHHHEEIHLSYRTQLFI